MALKYLSHLLMWGYCQLSITQLLERGLATIFRNRMWQEDFCEAFLYHNVTETKVLKIQCNCQPCSPCFFLPVALRISVVTLGLHLSRNLETVLFASDLLKLSMKVIETFHESRNKQEATPIGVNMKCLWRHTEELENAEPCQHLKLSHSHNLMEKKTERLGQKMMHLTKFQQKLQHAFRAMSGCVFAPWYIPVCFSILSTIAGHVASIVEHFASASAALWCVFSSN